MSRICGQSGDHPTTHSAKSKPGGVCRQQTGMGENFLKNFIEKQIDKKRRGAEEHTAKVCRLNFETGGISHVSK
jgi:hypothetical protein